MWIIHLVFLIALLIITDSKYMRITSKSRNVFFKYRDGVTGEKSLPRCQQNDVCNIVYKRFWLDDVVERLCRCPGGDECPWTDKFDNHTMSLNNRSFLKFCKPLSHKKTCRPRKTAAVVRGWLDENFTNMTIGRVRVNCFCPKSHFWHLKKFDYTDNKIFQHFKCSKQRQCGSYEFCGLVRPDLFSIYYRCTCPPGNICIRKDDKLEHGQELVYTGAVMSAYCDPWNKSSRYY